MPEMAFPLPHRIADDRDRQATEVPDARGDGGATGAGGAEDGLRAGFAVRLGCFEPTVDDGDEVMTSQSGRERTGGFGRLPHKAAGREP